MLSNKTLQKNNCFWFLVQKKGFFVTFFGKRKENIAQNIERKLFLWLHWLIQFRIWSICLLLSTQQKNENFWNMNISRTSIRNVFMHSISMYKIRENNLTIFYFSSFAWDLQNISYGSFDPKVFSKGIEKSYLTNFFSICFVTNSVTADFSISTLVEHKTYW